MLVPRWVWDSTEGVGVGVAASVSWLSVLHSVWLWFRDSFLPGMPASPMGDILQTPQFQLRRLKKQLVAERENRDELELELAENRKLLAEKGQ